MNQVSCQLGDRLETHTGRTLDAHALAEHCAEHGGVKGFEKRAASTGTGKHSGQGGTVIWENPHHADYGKEDAR